MKNKTKHEGRFTAQQRRRLSEEGKRLLRDALTHSKDGDEDHSVDYSIQVNHDDSSSESELESFDEWKKQGVKKGTNNKKGKNDDTMTGKEILKELITDLEEKRDEKRIEVLEEMINLLCSQVMQTEITNNKDTLLCNVLTCMKKRNPESCRLCLQTLAIVAITLGSEEDEYYHSMENAVSRIVTDNCDQNLRIAAVSTLSIACFVMTTEDSSKWHVIDITGSLIMGNNWNDESDTEADSISDVLMESAIECWAFLISFFPPTRIVPMIYNCDSAIYDHIMALRALVKHGVDLKVRAKACEALALIIGYKYTISHSSWSYSQEPKSSTIGGLLPLLHQFMKETGKNIGKKNRKTQRSMLKEVLETLEYGTGPQHDLYIENEIITLDTWSSLFQSTVLCQVLKTGFQIHLAHNGVLRDIFEISANTATKPSMIATSVKRAGNKTKAVNLRTSIAMKRRSQNLFMYPEY